ncbi:hypothetical protein INT43_006348 [Umbelopsis isabellina]|uniref:RNA helicase n=1 Tax=Mortierella isabellina TaxID=91625 RepID=A0A8H7Q0X0_MORIS|nr:hypothetical protein INT43_006348 [Umbelopsis isabellina]
MAFWKPGTVAPGSTVDRETENETSEILTVIADQSYRYLSIQQQRERLPIFKSRTQLLYLIESYQTLVVVGQTGCGKTTQLPQYLEEAGWATESRKIACTQPRRVAATTVAQRVAEEVGGKLGDKVGYTIRFEDVTSENTRIKYMTDGMLFRETLIDPLLMDYSVIMIDEAHERSLYTDILLGVLKKIQKKRPDLRLIISSATLDAEEFYDFFNSNTTKDKTEDTSTIISLEGRMYPVDVLYTTEPVNDYVEKAIQTVFDIHTKEPNGDILIFMTGREEIDRVVSEISDRASTLPQKALGITPLPIYAGLTTEEQAQIFEPTQHGFRKVIVATNIAEASITIDGVVYVIDCGFVKVGIVITYMPQRPFDSYSLFVQLRAYNPKTGMESLTVAPISKASAKQRAGRAGRVKPGKCYRLYTEESFMQLRDSSVPEMQRSNLAPVILQLKALGIDNVLRFHFLTPPPVEMMTRALEATYMQLLYSLKALDNVGRLSIPLGVHLAEIPVDPLLGKVLLSSADFHCSEEILSIAAMLTVQNVYIQPGRVSQDALKDQRRKFWVEEGDHISLLNIYNSFVTRGKLSGKWCHEHYLNFKALSRAVSIRQQLKKYLRRFNIPLESCLERYGKSASGRMEATREIRRCITSGYFSQAAKADVDGSGRFRTIRDNVLLNIHPSSVLFSRNAKYVVFHEVVETNQAYMRDVTVIEPEWLTELAPHFYEYKK